jgi:glycosyltransferase involved in cell wall biosynthesis
MLEPSDILFLGLGKSAVLWYRCTLPAMHLGADWCGIIGQPPTVNVVTGLVRGDTQLPRYEDYKIVVLQQPWGRAWLSTINRLRNELGIKVLYEVDDYLHGVAKQTAHDFARHYNKDALRQHEMCMRACDGMICSTDYIARRYARYNRNVYVCKNGLDIARYKLTRPERKTVNIGWAGATGHVDPLVRWMNEIIPVMAENPQTNFVAIGQAGLAHPIGQILGDDRRAIGIPWAPLECYPAAMCMMDIAIAPSGDTSWYRGKSDLRWLEASALGIPTIADPVVYPEVEHGVTGVHADSPAAAAQLLAAMLNDPEWTREMGRNAKAYIEQHRTSDIAAAQWMEVLSAVHGGHESMAQLRRA